MAVLRPPIRSAYVVLWLWGPRVSVVSGASWSPMVPESDDEKRDRPDHVISCVLAPRNPKGEGKRLGKSRKRSRKLEEKSQLAIGSPNWEIKSIGNWELGIREEQGVRGGSAIA